MKINQYFITNNESISIDDAEFSVYSIDDFKIYSHSKLKVNCFENEHNALIILGDIFDCFNPDNSNVDIGNSLIKSDTLKKVLQTLDKLTGRFVIFVKIEGSWYLLSDFFGQRQVYYWYKNNKFYASSSDKLLLDTLGVTLEMDDIKQQLSRSNYFLKIHEHWLLGKTDWDNRLMKLLPNHYLNIQKVKQEHIPIYVNRTSDKTQLEKDVLNVIKNSINAYSKRYDLRLGLTSGYDSRLLLACSLSIKEKIKYFTFKRNDTYVRRDVAIAKQLAKRYQLHHQTIETDDLKPKFLNAFNSQFLVPRILDKTKNIQWFQNQKLRNTAVISGNGGALIRSIYNEADFKNIKTICKAIEYEPSDIHLKALDSWLKSAKVYASENEILLSDLFYLEIRLGKWGNKMVHELDFANIEEFTPYNNRYVLFSLLLNYNEAERKAITLNLLEQSTEGITKLPFNPKTWKDTVKRIIFYEHYKKWIQKIK
ncbi:MAG: hypothetical protein R2816_11685 [Flavobacteriaceae bacterium]|nr:hypothetical protein [Flavobacteriaceae bacterium]